MNDSGTYQNREYTRKRKFERKRKGLGHSEFEVLSGSQLKMSNMLLEIRSVLKMEARVRERYFRVFTL